MTARYFLIIILKARFCKTSNFFVFVFLYACMPYVM